MPSAAAEAARQARVKEYSSRAHKALVAQTKDQLRRGPVLCMDPAPGCRRWIHLGQPFDIAHDHHDRSRYLGPACRRCNRWWAAYLTNMRAKARELRRGQVAPGGVFGPLSS